MVLPTVTWSQRPETVFIKVEVPSGVQSAEALVCEGTKLAWKEGRVNLEVDLFAELDSSSIKITRDECVISALICQCPATDL